MYLKNKKINFIHKNVSLGEDGIWDTNNGLDCINKKNLKGVWDQGGIWWVSLD